MQTTILNPSEVKIAAELLLKGEVVAFPTETVYGLGAAIFDPEAIQKIFTVKGRPSDNPLIAHISSLDQLSHIAKDVPEDFFRLAKAFFPGPLTIIVSCHPNVPKVATAGLDTIGIRMPSLSIARELISCVGQPLVAPSANLSGKPSATCVSHVLDDFSGKISAVLAGDECSLGIESTVVQLLEDKILLLRPGSISKEEIASVAQKPVEIYTHSGNKEEKVASPGMKYRHYAPKAQMHVFTSWEELFDTMLTLHSYKVLVIGPEEKKNEVALESYAILSRESLYKTLRRCDTDNVEKILVYCDAKTLQDLALMNRLLKASL